MVPEDGKEQEADHKDLEYDILRTSKTDGRIVESSEEFYCQGLKNLVAWCSDQKWRYKVYVSKNSYIKQIIRHKQSNCHRFRHFLYYVAYFWKTVNCPCG